MGAVGAVFLTLLLARGVQHTLRLLLSGVVVGVVLGALSSLVMLMAPEVLQAMQAFLLGSTGFVGWSACLLMLVVWVFSMVLAWWFSPVLDGLALGEATAQSLGLPLVKMRLALVAVLALATGAGSSQTLSPVNASALVSASASPSATASASASPCPSGREASDEPGSGALSPSGCGSRGSSSGDFIAAHRRAHGD